MRYFLALLVFVPMAIGLELVHGPATLIFLSSAIGVIPLAGLMGVATDRLVLRTGPRLGGLINATLGNAAELIIAIFALRAGLLELVKASITGSILGNILLVLGLSILMGGLRNGVQRFDRQTAGLNATMMTLAAIALVIPAIFGHAIEQQNHQAVEYLSLGVAAVMMCIYVLSVGYLLFSGEKAHSVPEEEGKRGWSMPFAVVILLGATAFICWLSEILVGVVEEVVASWGVTEFFLGVIAIPLVGNVAEHLVAVQFAWQNRMELSLAISVGSSLQIGLFVAPVLVFLSLLLGGEPLNLVFNQFEIISLAAAVGIAGLISLDGETTWLEGAQLLGVYIIIALAFFFLPV